jgi:hypothetical protein
LLVIDALDASRGEASETVFANLIEDAVGRLGERWSVVASIRTFDLKNGRRFREVLKGAPPHPGQYSEAGFNEVRHFKIPRLSDAEVAKVAQASSELGSLTSSAPASLKELLRNVFNLSLAAELIAIGVPAESIRTITTQSDLIDRYEDKRLASGRLKEAVAVAVETMVKRRRLSIKRVAARHEALDDVLATGVMTEAGDLITFAHHVLFDHIAGRFFLEWNDPQLLAQQITSEPGIGLMLAPSLRFAMERVWREDKSGRQASWRLIAAIAAVAGADPVISSVALRFGADRVADIRDVGALTGLISSSPDTATTGSMLSRLARFVRMSIAESGAVAISVATAWASVAFSAAEKRDRHFADAARFFLWTLSEKADFGDQAFAEAFGKSAREVLRFAWALDPEIPAFTRDGIRFVARSFATAPSDSRALLEKVLDEPRFSEHAHEEAPWLADGVPYIFKSDPQFAVRIYEVLFGRPAPQTGKTWFGGHRSRILPLISDRKQEYEHARWHLTRALKSFLAENPEYGVKAVINAAIGLSRHAAEPETLELSLDGLSVTVVDDYDSLEDWRVRDKRAGDTADDILGLFVDFLRSCSPSVFRAAIDTALRVKANTSVWSRLLGLAAERRAIADDLLWILATNPKFLSFRGVSREAISYLAAVYASRDAAERRDFEARSLNADLFEEERARNWWNALMARFLSVVSEDALMTDQMRALRRQLHEAGKLTGNRPFVSISSGWAPADNVVESLLKSSGVDLQRSADLEIRNVAQPLETFLKTVEKRGDDREIEQLWTMVQAVVGTIERVTEPHAESLHSSWGAVSNAIERIAQNKSYDPTKPGVPSLDALIALIERLMESPYPEVSERDDDGGLMGWGNWDIRVYAASSRLGTAFRNGSP